MSDDFAAALGYTPAELIGRSSLEFLDEDPDVIMRRLEELAADGAHGDTVALLTRTGRRLVIAYRMRLLHGAGGRVCYVGAAEPVDELEPDAAARPPPAAVLVTKAEAAAIGRVNVRTVERWIADGLIPAGGGRGSRRIPLVELESFLAGRIASATLLALLTLLATWAALIAACALGVELATDALNLFRACPL